MNLFIRGLLLVVVPLAALADAHVPTGRWIVSHHLDATELSVSPAILKRYVGKTLTVSTDSIEFADETCRIANAHQIGTDEEARKFFLQEYKADYAVLRLVAPILIVDTDCNIVVSDSRKRVVFDWYGDFFEARAPAKKKRP